jgi:hypothetical protein
MPKAREEAVTAPQNHPNLRFVRAPRGEGDDTDPSSMMIDLTPRGANPTTN